MKTKPKSMHVLLEYNKATTIIIHKSKGRALEILPMIDEALVMCGENMLWAIGQFNRALANKLSMKEMG